MNPADPCASGPSGEACWDDPLQPTRPASHGFSDLVDALREAQEAVTRGRPSAAAGAEAARLLREAAGLLAPFEVGEDEQLAGRLWTEAGRAQALAPAVHIDAVTPSELRGTVAFGRFHAGRGAVHGGVLPLVFDEVMSRLGNGYGRPRGRTAYLRTDYRALVPVGEPLDVRGWLVSERGRKRYLRAELTRGGRLLSEAEGLWVVLREGQP
ncbi:PaaI family thioesterase [Actinomadura geliboluensis]|uniref:PaaI family thioesterase n=1 Tax=Actinomadura geliboluensis TaxID=882440 RepID=UPI003713F2D9